MKIVKKIGLALLAVVIVIASYLVYGTFINPKSPRDTVSITQEDLILEIDYSRPFKKDRLIFLLEFFSLFLRAVEIFKKTQPSLQNSQHKKKASELLKIFKILKKQTRKKLKEQIQIKDRLVSLDELDARPIKKGKAFPKTEFDTKQAQKKLRTYVEGHEFAIARCP